jgi:beta-galactosidase
MRAHFMRWLMVVSVVLFMRFSVPAAAAESASGRSVTPLEAGWRFLPGDAAGAEQPVFRDDAWERVTVPHTWNAKDGQTRTYRRGIGWYRLHLKPEAVPPGRRLFLRFEAACTTARVFVNGRDAGEHRGAFGAFCFEITHLVTPGAETVVAVKVDNSRQADVAPLAGDFNLFGGLYRPAALLALDPTCITPLDYASPGVYIRQDAVSREQAELTITAKLLHAGVAPTDVTVSARIADATGKEVALVSEKMSLASGETKDAVLKTALRNPHLWNGRADPYLYSVTVTLFKDGRAVDAVTQPLGVRTFAFDKARGFLLNGVVTPIRGVNRHQDRDGKGWALSPRDHEEDVELIWEIGANGVRLAHYQHSDYFYSLCDRKGLLVWAELPCVNELRDTPEFRANAALQLRELVRQNYNHPSIFCWSLWNELLNGVRLPKDSRKQTIAAWCDIVRELNDLAHAEDPGRQTACATNSGTELNKITDLLAWNHYPGWYGGMGGLGGGGFEGISEYGAGANPLHHEQGCTKGPSTTGQWHPEEWQATVHEKVYASFAQNPLKWGSFVWNMFDFASSGRNEGALPGRNDKGLVTYDRQMCKDAFFFYKATWRQDIPVVYITSRRDTPRTTDTATVKVYANCTDLTVSVNGTPLPPVKGDGCVFVWENVPLKMGRNVVKAAGTRGSKTASDTCTWERVEKTGKP